jgi:superfamily I DNA/RNA helicase
MLKHFRDRSELSSYIDDSGDVNLASLLAIVTKFGGNVPNLYFSLKEKALGTKERDNADIIFTTTHKSKGLEYDHVEVLDDFYDIDEIKNLATLDNYGGVNLNEEVNLLYVAITRGLKSSVYDPFL